MADAMDSKSIVRKVVWVRLPPPVSKAFALICKGFFLFEISWFLQRERTDPLKTSEDREAYLATRNSYLATRNSLLQGFSQVLGS